MLDIYNNVNITTANFESYEEAHKHYQTLVSKGIACTFFPGYEDWQVKSYEPISKVKAKSCTEITAALDSLAKKGECCEYNEAIGDAINMATDLQLF